MCRLFHWLSWTWIRFDGDDEMMNCEMVDREMDNEMVDCETDILIK